MSDAAAAMDLGGGLFGGGGGGDPFGGGGGGDPFGGGGGDPFGGGDPMGMGGSSLSDLAGGAFAAPGMSASSYGGNVAATAQAQNDPTGGQGALQNIAAAQPQPGTPGGGIGGTQSGPPPINAGTLPPPGAGPGSATPASPGTPVRTTSVPQQSVPTMPIPGNVAMTPQGGFSSGAEEPSFTPQSSLTTSPPSPGYSAVSDRFGQWMTNAGTGATGPVTAQAPQAQPSIIQAAPGPGEVQTAAPDQPAPAAPPEPEPERGLVKPPPNSLNAGRTPEFAPSDSSSKGDLEVKRLSPEMSQTMANPLDAQRPPQSTIESIVRQALGLEPHGGMAGPTGDIGNLPPSAPSSETEYTQPPAKTDTPAKTAPAKTAPATRAAPAAPAAPSGGHWEIQGGPGGWGRAPAVWVPDTTAAAAGTAAPGTTAPGTSSAQPGAGAGTPQQQAQQQLDNFLKQLPMSSLLGLARALFGPRWPGWQGLPHWAPPPAGRAPFAAPPNTAGAPKSSAPAAPRAGTAAPASGAQPPPVVSSDRSGRYGSANPPMRNPAFDPDLETPGATPAPSPSPSPSPSPRSSAPAAPRGQLAMPMSPRPRAAPGETPPGYDSPYDAVQRIPSRKPEGEYGLHQEPLGDAVRPIPARPETSPMWGVPPSLPDDPMDRNPPREFAPEERIGPRGRGVQMAMSKHAVGTEVPYSRTTTPTLSPAQDPRGLESYIRQAAQRNGVNPDTAVRVAMREGLNRFDSGIRGEKSYGAFQLNTQGGRMGTEFQRETGLDPSNPRNEKATIDYAMKRAARDGWGAWMGARAAGITGRMGIGPRGAARPQGVSLGWPESTDAEQQQREDANFGETARSIGELGAHANWDKFLSEARRSTNIEDNRNAPATFNERYAPRATTLTPAMLDAMYRAAAIRRMRQPEVQQ